MKLTKYIDRNKYYKRMKLINESLYFNKLI